jgi:hypothetical protein
MDVVCVLLSMLMLLGSYCCLYGTYVSRMSCTTVCKRRAEKRKYTPARRALFNNSQPIPTHAQQLSSKNGNSVFLVYCTPKVDFLGTLGTSIDRFRSTMQESNQKILADIHMLNSTLQQQQNTSVPPAPMIRLPTPEQQEESQQYHHHRHQ